MEPFSSSLDFHWNYAKLNNNIKNYTPNCLNGEFVKKLLFFLLITTSFTPIYTMQKTTIPSCIGYTIAGTQLLKDSIGHYLSCDSLLKQPKPDKTVSDFLESYIPATGYTEPLHIRLYFWLSGPQMGSFKGNIIIISNYAHNDIRSLLEKQQKVAPVAELSEIQKQLDGYGALFQHEIGHLKNNDVHKRVYLTLAVSLSSLGISHLLNQCLFKKQITTLSGNVVWGICITLINFLITKEINKKLELQADKSIPANKKVLEGFRKFMAQLDEREKSVIAAIGKNNSPFIAQLKRNTLKFIIDCFEDHPSYEDRIARIDERLGSIK